MTYNLWTYTLLSRALNCTIPCYTITKLMTDFQGITPRDFGPNEAKIKLTA